MFCHEWCTHGNLKQPGEKYSIRGGTLYFMRPLRFCETYYVNLCNLGSGVISSLVFFFFFFFWKGQKDLPYFMTQQGPNKCMTDSSFNWLDMHILYLLLCNLRAKDSAGHTKQTDLALIYLFGRFGKNCTLTCCLWISSWQLHHVYITVSHMIMGQSVFPLFCFRL